MREQPAAFWGNNRMRLRGVGLIVAGFVLLACKAQPEATPIPEQKKAQELSSDDVPFPVVTDDAANLLFS